jgi:hypothetical protein
MNRTVGFWSSCTVTATVLLFALMMLLGQDYGAYASSMLLSWGYLVLACSFSAIVRDNENVAAQAGVAFAVLYAGFVTTVYFVQLTTVLHQSAAPDILQTLSYQQVGSLMFNLDLLGYGLMAVSTFFVGLTVVGRKTSDRWLRFLLLAHGIFAPICVALPILNIFASMPRESGDGIGIAVLFAWCIYFTPVALLAIHHFRPVSLGDAEADNGRMPADTSATTAL